MGRAPLLLGAMALAALAAWGLLHPGGEADTGGTPGTPGEKEVAAAPALVGTADAAGPESEEAWDLRALVASAAMRESGLSRRVAARALADPEGARRLARDLVEGLRERYDAEPRVQVSQRAGFWPGPIAEVLRLLGPIGAEALAEVLADADATLRVRAALVLGHLGDLAAPHVPALAERARDLSDAPNVRAAVIRSLGVLGEHAAEFGPDLIAWAMDDAAPEDVAEAVAGAMLRVAGTTKEALDAARGILVRQALAPCLALLGTIRERANEAASLAPDLLELLATVQQDGPVEREALGVLGAIASGDVLAQRFLLATFEDDGRRNSVRGQAAAILGRSGESGRKALLEAASRRDEEDRLLAFDVLAGEAPPTWAPSWRAKPQPVPPLLPDLLALLQPLLDARDDDVREQALVRLAPRLRGEDLDLLLPSLLARLRDPDPRRRANALFHLQCLPEIRKEVIAACTPVLGDSQSMVRMAAAGAILRHQGADPKAALEAWTWALESEERALRYMAVEALPELAGFDRPGVLAALERATGDKDETVAKEAEHRRAQLRGKKAGG